MMNSDHRIVVPGADVHAFTLNSPQTAVRFAARLTEVAAAGGTRPAVIQFTHADDTSRRTYLKGRAAVLRAPRSRARSGAPAALINAADRRGRWRSRTARAH